jgi:SnoaL-like polyketide cyclase
MGRIASSIVADGGQGIADGLTRKALLGTGLATAAGYVAAPTALGATNRDTATAKRLAKLRKAREKVVIEHGRAENVGQIDKTMDTFSRAYEENIPLGNVYTGHDEVKGYYEASSELFPDQRTSDSTLRHADCAVIAEFMLSGTMKGALGPMIPATNKSFRLRATAFFLFAPNTAKLVGERLYFDLFSLFQQIGVLQALVDGGAQFPAGGGVPINRREPGVKAAVT